MPVLLAVAAWCHPIRRERRWLVPALLLSAAGDFFLAMPWWKPSFVLGLGAAIVWGGRRWSLLAVGRA